MTTADFADFHEIPFAQRTRALAIEHYHRQFPLLAAYDLLVREHNTDDRDINTPRGAAGLDNLQLADLALRQIGKPPRDREDVVFAASYIESLREELSLTYPYEPPPLTEEITRVEFGWAGCVLRADDFTAMSEDEQHEHVNALIDGFQGESEDHLHTALMAALPGLYEQIRLDDQRRRQERADLLDVDVDAGLRLILGEQEEGR